MTVSKNVSLGSVAPWIFTTPTPTPSSTPAKTSALSWHWIKYSEKNEALTNRLLKASIVRVTIKIANKRDLVFKGLPTPPSRKFTAITPGNFFSAENHFAFSKEQIIKPEPILFPLPQK
ncbi:MAG: hypothetical protein JSS09_09115 [Verrucomicrobia bacterium]|nr:hypothetical protein [Verrucomicrobiota bacterium]